MNRLFVTILSLAIVNIAFADKLIMHNSTELLGKVTEISENFIKYIPAGEELIRSVGPQAISKIEFENGKIEEITPRVIIPNPKTDWDNIPIVYEKSAVQGMVKVGEDTKKANSAWSTNTKKEGLEKKVFEKLKKECVKKGGVVILVVRKDSQSQGGFGSYGFAEISAEFYTY